MQTDSPSNNWQETAEKLRKQLLIERLAIALVLLFLLGRWAYGYFAGATCAIVADGKPIVLVENKSLANKLMDEVLQSASGTSEEAKFLQNITIQRRGTGTPLDREAALAVLKAKLTVAADKWAIMIDGKPYVAVDTKEQAGETLELARQKYGSRVDNLLEEPSFKESVKPQIAKVDLRLWRSTPQEAVEVLFRPTGGRPLVHVVKKGEVTSGIAHSYHIRLAEMARLNPGRSLDKLKIGDQLKIAEGKVPLTVVVKDQVSRTESIEPRIESITSVRMYSGKTVTLSPGRPGRRQVKLAIVYENGAERGREVLEETILRNPTPKKVAVGVKPRR